MRAVRHCHEPAFVVYVEPGDYKLSASPTDLSLFDLSEKIEGIAPLPGFVSLTREPAEEGVFVPLLGFEGARFAYMLEAVQPKREDIIPIIGVPGFRLEYPFYTYQGNKIPLHETKAWKNVRFAPANCPFAAYQAIQSIANDYKNRRLNIGLIGTKPHSLGGLLYHIDYPRMTEVLYDFPIRKVARTEGTSRLCLYNLSLLPPP